jgi:hypothetical protein
MDYLKNLPAQPDAPVKIDFNKLLTDPSEGVRLVQERAEESDKGGAWKNLLFYRGQHFGPSGEFWTGPRPIDAHNPAALNNIKREFASKNGIKTATKGHLNGVVGREVEWSFNVRRPLAKKGEVVGTTELTEDEKPNAEEAARIREIQSALTVWWNDNLILKVIRDATADLLNTGRSAIRIYVPPTELGTDPATGEKGLNDAPDLESALRRIFLLHHPYNQCTVVRDQVSMKHVGIFVSEEDGQQRVELTFIDPNGQTIVRILTKDKNQATVPYTPSSTQVQSVFSSDTQIEVPRSDETALSLNGHLMMFEMQSEPLISPQVRQSNKSLNKAKTLRGHNLNMAGFREKEYVNIDVPGVLEDDPKREGGKKFVPDPIYRGASNTNTWASMSYTDAQGNPQRAPFEIHESEPSPVNVFIESERADYQDIMEETGQAHKLMAGDATASGESRIQAKAEFGVSLFNTKGEVDSLVRWILETVASMAAQFIGRPGLYDDLRVNADCRIDTGPVLPDEIRIGIELVEKKIISRARLQRIVGVEDTEIEDTLILADEEKLNPIKTVQLERAKTNLAIDQRSTDGGIAARLD